MKNFIKDKEKLALLLFTNSAIDLLIADILAILYISEFIQNCFIVLFFLSVVGSIACVVISLFKRK